MLFKDYLNLNIPVDNITNINTTRELIEKAYKNNELIKLLTCDNSYGIFIDDIINYAINDIENSNILIIPRIVMEMVYFYEENKDFYKAFSDAITQLVNSDNFLNLYFVANYYYAIYDDGVLAKSFYHIFDDLKDLLEFKLNSHKAQFEKLHFTFYPFFPQSLWEFLTYMNNNIEKDRQLNLGG